VAPTPTASALRCRLLAAAAVSLFALCASSAIAQAPAKPKPQPPRPQSQAPAAPQSQAPAAAPSKPPAPPRFAIQRFLVEGNSLLAQGELDRILAPFSGKDRDFGDIQRALEALQDVYTRRGYNAVRVSVPEQDIRSGQVRLRVVEARIRRVQVQGNRFFDEKNVRAGLPSLKEGTSPNTRAIGQDAQLVNENPAKQVSVALQAADEPGQVDATVRVTDEKPSKVSVFADNTGTPQTGNLRTGLGYQNANLFNGDDVINAQYLTSPGHASDVKVFGASYRAPVYKWSGVVDVLAGYSSVNSGTVLDFFNVSGKGTVFGLRYTQLLGRIDSYEHRVALGWDYRAYKNSVIFGDSGQSEVPDITVRPASLTYSGRASQVGRDLSFNLSYSRNIPGGRNGDQDAFTATQDSSGNPRTPARPGASAKYSIWRAGVAFSQLLPSDFIMRAAANAQKTNDLLIPGEQFGMGGADSVRGYYERETASDIGRRISLEGYGPDFGSWIGGTWHARALLFVDAARGHDNEPPRSPEVRLGSFGVGLRANQGKSFAFRLDAARVTEDAGTRLKGETRVHFAAAYSF
jgi:hemolysin activation/secretion protein